MRHYLTLLHLPTTSALLSLTVVGLIPVPLRHPERFLLLVVEGFLMVGIASNYLDELKGRPWKTTIPSEILWIVGIFSYITSTSIGVFLSFSTGYWFLLFVFTWAFLVPCYSLELFNGFFHNGWVVAFSTALNTLAASLIQVPEINLQNITISTISGIIALNGRQHYELGKASGRNHSQDLLSKAFWQRLRLEILLIDIIALMTLIAKIH